MGFITRGDSLSGLSGSVSITEIDEEAAIIIHAESDGIKISAADRVRLGHYLVGGEEAVAAHEAELEDLKANIVPVVETEVVPPVVETETKAPTTVQTDTRTARIAAAKSGK